jgi:hypothetical protein
VSLPLEEIRRALPPDAMLVEYYRSGSRLLAFLVTRDRLEVVPVALVPRVPAHPAAAAVPAGLGHAPHAADVLHGVARLGHAWRRRLHLAELYSDA